MSDLFIEITDGGNPDMRAFSFCCEAIIKESKDQRKHVTRLYVENGVCYGCNGKTVRKTILNNEYLNGFFRVLRNEKNDIILYFDGNEDHPDFDQIVSIDGISPIGEISIGDDFLMAHAILTHLTNTVFKADVLKKAAGTYHVFKKETIVVLDDGVNAIGIAPIQTQTTIPGV